MSATIEQHINQLKTTKLRRVEALRLCDQFVASATDEAAYGTGFAFFGRMRAAADAIPADFEALDKRPAVKGQDKRLQPYLRSQLFIALISEIEDFLFSLLRLVIVQYPKKIGSKTVSVERLVELGSDGVITESIDKTLNELAYAGPAEYRKALESYLSIEGQILDRLWPTFVEMKARRDAGVHNGWNKNPVYQRKVEDGGGTVPLAIFLGISDEYFSDALQATRLLIDVLSEHTIGKFAAHSAAETVPIIAT